VRFTTQLALADAAFGLAALAIAALALRALARTRGRPDLVLALSPVLRAVSALSLLAVTVALLSPGHSPFALLRYASFAVLLALPALLGGAALLLRARRLPALVLGAGALLLGAVAVDAFLVEPRRLTVVNLALASRVALPRPLRLALVADLQCDDVGDHERRALQTVAGWKPDLLLFAGDFLQTPDDESFRQQSALLSPLLGECARSARLGAFAVPGNSDRRRLLPALFEGTGISYLVDESRLLDAGGVPLLVTGLSVHRGFTRDEALLRPVLRAPPEGGLHLVLSHGPDFAPAASRLGTVDLALAGHTHGGQVVVPGFGPPITFSRLPRAMASGAHRIGNLTLVVSKGVGMERLNAPRLRFFCPPDVTLIEWGGLSSAHQTDRGGGRMKLASLLILLTAMAAIVAAAPALAQARPAADLLITNGKVWAGAGRPRAEALAVLGERIVAVGSAAEVEAWRGPSTRVVDARGRSLLPGFNDAHLHMTAGGASLERVDLRDAATPEEFRRRLGERARATPQGEWLLGWGWDHENWTPAALPTRQLVDAVTGETPLWVGRTDGHMALANSAALKLAGVTRETPDPPGGTVVRDAAGEPTGILKDAAMTLVESKVPPMTREQRRRAIQAALKHAASLGVTSFQDMGSEEGDISVLAELSEKGELTARVHAAVPLSRVDDEARLGLRRAFGSPWLRIGSLKGYADGSLGSTTAYFFEPYLDAPTTAGLLGEEMQPLEKMRSRMLKAEAAGLQLCLHAIGDRAISMTLDLFEEVVKAGPRDRRLRIEHAQHVAPKDFERFRALEVIASMQPTHAIDDGRWAEKRIGKERARTTYAFRTFLDRGVRLAFGTDWPVAFLDPLTSLYAAVTRETTDGKHPGGWVPEQKVTLAEALEAYTLGSAYAEYQEKEKGTLEAGKLADVVLLSGDLFAVDPKKLRDVKVVATWVGGRQVFGDR